MKKINKLGIFDSGLGGYTVYKDLRSHYPNLALVLFADQKNAPYGNYSNDKIKELATAAMQWFKDHDIFDVLLACNTVTSVALSYLKERFPEMRIYGIVELTISQLPKDALNVGVVGTVATINAHAYQDAYHKHYKGEVIERPLKELAYAIENLEEDSVIDDIITDTVKEMEGCSHIILGCTHYPLVKDRFEKISNAIFVDSIKPIREFVGQNYEKTNTPSRIVTTKDAEILKQQIKILYHEDEKVGEI